MKSKTENIKKLTVTAILSAIVVLLSFLPLKTMGLEINFSMVPVAIGAIMYGPYVGAFLGGVFGTVSFIQCFGYSAFGVMLLGESFVKTIIVCIPTRILAGLLVGLIFKAFKKHKALAYPIASILAPLLNTIFFMSSLVLCFYNGDTVQYFVELLSAANPFMFIILFVGINGLVEILAGFLVTFPTSKALSRYFKI